MIPTIILTTSSAQQSSRIFDAAEIGAEARVSLDVEERIENGSVPLGYLRHRYVKTDIARLLELLKKTLSATKLGHKDNSFPLGLFDDNSVEFVIEQWSHGNFSVNIAEGDTSTHDRSTLRTKFIFVQDDLSSIYVSTADTWYRIEKTNDSSIFVIYESEHVAADM